MSNLTCLFSRQFVPLSLYKPAYSPNYECNFSIFYCYVLGREERDPPRKETNYVLKDFIDILVCSLKHTEKQYFDTNYFDTTRTFHFLT